VGQLGHEAASVPYPEPVAWVDVKLYLEGDKAGLAAGDIESSMRIDKVSQ
jgi:hypothetical protein